MLSTKNVNLTKEIIVVDFIGNSNITIISGDRNSSSVGRGLGVEVDLIDIELLGSSGVNSHTIIIGEFTLGNELGHRIISGFWENSEIGSLLLQIVGGHSCFDILHRNNLSTSQVNVEVTHSGGEILGHTSGRGGEAGLILKVVLKQVAPGSGWEVEVSIFSSKLIRDNRKLESISNHDVALSVSICVRVVGELEVERLVEGSNHSLLHQGKLSVIVSNESVLGCDGILHDVHVGQGSVVVDGLSEHWLPRFLGDGAESVVVPGERIEGTNNVPSSAEFLSGITNETTDV